jgi:4-amino-4-deoxy-L-arabinose transferase-like glycosyltransferase
MMLVGRRDELLVRLPNAGSALATVALIYAFGRRTSGRAVGLSSALILCSTGFFVGEMRQASNDGPLVLFTTLALYAVWRRLENRDEISPAMKQPLEPQSAVKLIVKRASRWVLPCALGLGFLAKGPIILLVVGATVIPYLACFRRLRWGIRRLADGWGVLLFSGIALSWPVAVMIENPSALLVWSLEISEKTGLSRILEHRRHPLLAQQWPGMVLPWTFIGVMACCLPIFRMLVKPRRETARPCGHELLGSSVLWFAWWWAMGNLAVFCFWTVAKPSYYLPCLPGVALLIGLAWVDLARTAHAEGAAALAARGILQIQWVMIFVSSLAAPLVIRAWISNTLWHWTLAVALAMAAGVAVSIHLWRRGVFGLSLSPITAACALGIVIAYGIIAPGENTRRGHRTLAQNLEALVPPGVRAIMFFSEIDEGLWFYSRKHELVPVPGSQPRYNVAFDLAESYRKERLPFESLAELETKRLERDKRKLLDWLDRDDAKGAYMLIRSQTYDLYSNQLAGRVTPVFRERRLKRNELTLLRVAGDRPTPTTVATITRTQR